MLTNTNVKVVGHYPIQKKSRKVLQLRVLMLANAAASVGETRISFAQVAVTVNAKTTEQNRLQRYLKLN